VDVDRRQLIWRRLKDVAVVVDLDELAPVGGRAARGRHRRRFETWHFYLLPLEPISDPAYQACLQPQIRGMVEDYITLRQRFPRMEETWQPGWPGPVAEQILKEP
jgi:hypothetical protein